MNRTIAAILLAALLLLTGCTKTADTPKEEHIAEAPAPVAEAVEPRAEAPAPVAEAVEPRAEAPESVPIEAPVAEECTEPEAVPEEMPDDSAAADESDAADTSAEPDAPLGYFSMTVEELIRAFNAEYGDRELVIEKNEFGYWSFYLSGKHVATIDFSDLNAAGSRVVSGQFNKLYFYHIAWSSVVDTDLLAVILQIGTFVAGMLDPSVTEDSVLSALKASDDHTTQYECAVSYRWKDNGVKYDLTANNAIAFAEELSHQEHSESSYCYTYDFTMQLMP